MIVYQLTSIIERGQMYIEMVEKERSSKLLEIFTQFIFEYMGGGGIAKNNFFLKKQNNSKTL